MQIYLYPDRGHVFGRFLRTQCHLVLSSSKNQAWHFPALVSTSLPDRSDGWIVSASLFTLLTLITSW
ncbi:hypothetical protein SRHO_G00254540 [Serrasalmus rhombeus]